MTDLPENKSELIKLVMCGKFIRNIRSYSRLGRLKWINDNITWINDLVDIKNIYGDHLSIYLYDNHIVTAHPKELDMYNE